MRVLGVDPGEKGGIAVIGGESPEVLALPYAGKRLDLERTRAILAEWSPKVAYVELPGSRPKESSASGQSRGIAYGMLLALLWHREIPVFEVTPKKWKNALNLGSDKSEAVALCQRLFPSIDLIPGRCRTPQDGLAEALLIAEYGRRQG